ncbi:bacteriocin immunity protein [Pseudolactococcus yaeyamensis]
MNNKLKWYSGGDERKEKALIMMSKLLVSLSGNLKSAPLQKMLLAYKNEIELGSSAIPFILSRMNLDIAKVALENNMTLSQEQSDILKKLSSLSNIRFWVLHVMKSK